MKLTSKGGKYSANPKPVNPNPQNNAPADEASRRAASAARRKAAQKARRNREIWIKALIIFLSIMLATVLFLFGRKIWANNNFQQIAEQIQKADDENVTTPPTTQNTEPIETAPVETEPEETVPVETEPVVEVMLPKYVETYESNPDFFGWIRIDDTILDYPVMRCEENNEKYLYADFDGDRSYIGTPFADNKCTRDSDNIVIYGHNIRDGSMFRGILKYAKESYFKEHPTIMFSDLYGDYEYEVLAAFYDRVYYKHENVFKFYQFIDADDEEHFDYAIAHFKDKAIYDTGVDAEYGDKLITLVTCAYHVKNGRFVVVARRCDAE